jgi:hypothetical protein
MGELKVQTYGSFMGKKILMLIGSFVLTSRLHIFLVSGFCQFTHFLWGFHVQDEI